MANAIESQNRQASIGSIGSSPGNDDSSLIYTLTTEGRLSAPKEFEEIIVRTTNQEGRVGLDEFARFLQESGVELVSTGGTCKKLLQAGLKVRSINNKIGRAHV